MLNIHDNIKERLEYFKSIYKIPHIIFHGPSGGGKRTILNDFIYSIYNNNRKIIKSYVMTINCAHGKGIKFVRDELKFFAKTHIHSEGGNIFKSIVLLNADKLTMDAQSALRRCIELFSHNTRFFMVVENKYKLLKPILSRFCEIYVPLPIINGNPINIYKYNFVPTESISMWKKILQFTKKYGSLKDKYSSSKNATSLKDTINSTHIYPVLSIASRNIQVEYSSVNNNKNNEKKLLLANSSMGYPIYDSLGIMYPKSVHQFILYSNNNEKQLKQLQNYFLTNLLFYLIIITKTSQKFFDNKIFEVVPDITRITGFTDIDDSFLIKTFRLSANDLIGYRKYVESGEGRLDISTLREIKTFKLQTNKDTVKRIQDEIKEKLDEENIKQMKKDVKNITKKQIKHAAILTKKEGTKHDIHINKSKKVSKGVVSFGGKTRKIITH